MRVKDLIACLGTMPQDALVVLRECEGCCDEVDDDSSAYYKALGCATVVQLIKVKSIPGSDNLLYATKRGTGVVYIGLEDDEI